LGGAAAAGILGRTLYKHGYGSKFKRSLGTVGRYFNDPTHPRPSFMERAGSAVRGLMGGRRSTRSSTPGASPQRTTDEDPIILTARSPDPTTPRRRSVPPGWWSQLFGSSSPEVSPSYESMGGHGV